MELLDLIAQNGEKITQLKEEVAELKTIIKSLEKDVAQLQLKNAEFEKFKDEVMSLKSQLVPSIDAAPSDNAKVRNHDEKSTESMGEYNRFAKYADNR